MNLAINGFTSQKRIQIGLLLFLVSLSAWAGEFQPLKQDYQVTVWGVNEGLPVNSVTDIAQTPEGYLWAGTLISGLLRFDGIRFETFNSRNLPQLSSAGVRRLMVDQSGVLWINDFYDNLLNWNPSRGFSLILTNAGRLDALLWSQPDRVVFVRNRNQIFEIQKTAEGWQSSSVEIPGPVSKVLPCAAKNGWIWCWRNEHEIDIWHDHQFEKLTGFPGAEGQNILSLTSDQSGNIWAGTDIALLKWEDGRFVDRTPDTNESPVFVRHLIPAGNSLWVEGGGRLRRFTNGKWVAEVKNWDEKFQSIPFRHLRGDSKGGLWLANDDLGLLHIDPDGTLHKIDISDGLPSNVIRNLACDQDGNAWIGHDRGGLVQVRERMIKVVGRSQGLKETLLNSVCEDASGALWIGTGSKIYTQFKNGVCTHYELPRKSDFNDSVATADDKGRVWVGGSHSGLLLLTNDQFVQLIRPEQIPDPVRQLFSDRTDRLWVGTFNQIFKVEGATISTAYKVSNTSGRPAAITQSVDGTIWVGTSGGYLMQWDGTKFARYSVSDNQPQSLGRFWALCPAPDGGLWIGTSAGGVLRLINGKYLHLSTQNGLHSDRVVQVELDESGNLWLVTGVGIERVAASALARFEKGELDAVPVTKYGRSDGLNSIGGSIEFQPNCWHGKNGTLWFAMGNSIAGIDSNRVRANLLPPSVAIEELRVDDKSEWPDVPGKVLAATAVGPHPQMGTIPKVVIAPGQHELEFHFTGLSFSSPQQLQFKYQMTGLETIWHDADGGRSARYNFLPPGEYTFRVMAANSDAVWNERCAELKVQLRPFYYQTSWFQWIIGLGLIVGMGLTVWNVSRRRMRRRLEKLAHLRELEQNRARIAKDMHDEIGGKLARISYMSELATLDQEQSESAKVQINDIAETSRDLLQSLDEIVWVVNPHNDTLNHLADYLSQYAHDYFKNTHIECAIEKPPSLQQLTVPADIRHNLFLAFKESLTNVLKHSAARHVQINMQIQSGNFVIGIADDGKGFGAADPNRAGSASLNPDGLGNMRQRLVDIGGACTIGNGPGGGAEICLTFPLNLIKHGPEATH